MKVKYRCEKCGYSEKIKFWDYFQTNIVYMFASIGLGVVVIIAIYYNVTGETLGMYMLDSKDSRDFTMFADRYQDQLRDAALNMTEECSGDEPYCYAYEIYYHLQDIKYVPTSVNRILYHPIYTLYEGGDCKNTAALTTGLMRSLGFDAKVACSSEAMHCLTVVPYTPAHQKLEYDSIIIIDLAQSTFAVVNKTVNPFTI